MYMPGRSRTGCRPFRIEMSLAPYATRASPFEACCNTPVRHAKYLVSGGVFGSFSLPERGASNRSSGRRHDHSHIGQKALAAAPVRGPSEVASEISHTGRPRRLVDLDRAFSVAHRSHPRVSRDVAADELGPHRHEHIEI